jgi:glutathione synthase/RimK-type ligase-like ATP-grasp enzyme
MKQLSKPCTVVITARNDAHIPFVSKHLKNRLVTIDPLELVDGKGLTFALDDDKIIVHYGNEVLDNVTGVWYRKPQPIIRRELPVKDDYKLYSQHSLERHVMQLVTCFSNATWLSDYFVMGRANNKTLQIAIARQVGLRVPETIVTSSKEEAEAFVAEHPYCVSKPLTIGHPKVNGQQKVLLTTLIDPEHKPDFSNVFLAPTILQEAVDVQDDVRVIVVGDQVFAAIVNSAYEVTEDNKHLRDNRAGHYEGTVTITETKLPKEIADKCIKHVHSLNMQFGAIDLLVDKQGIWWFLENNPNGQWAYIEDATGQPIGKAIAELLENGVRS